jgi:hypothetical protein
MTTAQPTRACSHCGVPSAAPHASVRECLAALEKEALSLRLFLQHRQPPVTTVSLWARDKNMRT